MRSTRQVHEPGEQNLQDALAPSGQGSVADIATAHRLVKLYGRESAIGRLETVTTDRRLIDTIHRFYGSQESDLGVNYAGLCLLGLPHRELASKADKWHRQLSRPGFSCSLIVEPGDLNVDGELVTYGVPFGPSARIVLLYLQREAMSSGSREIELGPSLYAWLKKLGLAMGGKDYRRVREQMIRISACSIRFTWSETDGEGRRTTAFKKDNIVESGLLLLDRGADGRQQMLWQDRVVLSRSFYDALRERPVPVNMTAVRTIQHSSLALDLYLWLGYRLHALERPRLITWEALREQFGPDYARLRRFRERFMDGLRLALAVYPEARIDWDERGLSLFPSPPAVPVRSLVQVLGKPEAA